MKTILSIAVSAIFSVGILLISTSASELSDWNLPQTADAAKQDLIREFNIPDSICNFEIDGIPVTRAIIQWKTYGIRYGSWWTFYHTRAYDFRNKMLLQQSDY